MKLVIIAGSGAVGKMTVGQELMKQTKLRLFHNHMMIEPVIEVFGKYDSKVVSGLRDVIFNAFVKSDCEGMIFTYMWAFDHQSDWDYIRGLARLFEENGGTVYFVELTAPQEIRLQRNSTENRLKNKASKSDQNFSSNSILNEDKKYRLVSNEGEIPFQNFIKLDNTDLEPDAAARKIREAFDL